MARTSNIFTRVEPKIKGQAEKVLDQIGIPRSNAINIFFVKLYFENEFLLK